VIGVGFEVPVTEPFLMLILSSPSGAGKTTLTRKLREAFPELGFSVSHTTRAPRSTEKDGREYHFVDRPRFEKMANAGAFLEWAEVHGNLYGTSAAEVERVKAEKNTGGIIFDIDYQGARQIRAKVPDVAGVFILPPSMLELEKRLRGRRSETEDAVQRRFAVAKLEIEHYGLFDYVVVNDDLERTSDELRAIVLAERARRIRRAPIAELLLRTGELK
jgi:guanylate kinase